MKKVICSLASGPHLALLDLAGETFEWYATRHGYDLRLVRQAASPPSPPLAGIRRQLITPILWGINHTPISARLKGLAPTSTIRGRLADSLLDFSLRTLTSVVRPAVPTSWEKVSLIRQLLDEYDLVLWIDADALIVDPTEDIASMIQPGKWLYGVEHQVPDGAHLNCGVLMIQSTEASRQFLDDVLSRPQYMLHGWWEQAAMLMLLGYDVWPVRFARKTKYSDAFAPISNRWNSISLDPADEPGIAHHAGIGNAERLEQMTAQVRRFREHYASHTEEGVDQLLSG